MTRRNEQMYTEHKAMNSRRWTKYVSAAFLAVSLAACGNAAVTNTPPLPTNQPTVVVTPTEAPTEVPAGQAESPGSQTAEDITKHRQEWIDRQIAKYRFTIERSCFCLEQSRGPVTIEVRGDQVTITNVATGEQGNDYFNDVNTITKVYDLLAQQAKDGADEIAVTYDDANAVPSTIKVDVSFQMADEELYYTISNFETIS